MPVAQALAICGIQGPAAVNAFNRDGFQTVADFAQMTDKDIREMAVAMGARTQNQQGFKLGALQLKRVRALAHWARERAKRQLPIPDDMFNAALLAEAIEELNLGVTEEAEVKKPPKLHPDDWDTWEPAFINYLKSLKGADNTPLAYVIRDANLTAADFDPADSINRLLHSVALHGAAYTRDNQRVAMELISFITGTGAENFVDQASNDGRRMMTALRNHYNGPGEVTKRYKKAEERLKGLHYRNESVFPWSTFVSELTKCFTAYEKAGRPIDPRTKMDHLMTKCLPNELAPVKEVARTQHPNDIHAAANHIGERISEIFSAAIVNRERLRAGRGGGRARRISSVGQRSGGRGRGFGRGGRGFGRGRGGGRGQGGRHRHSPYSRDNRSHSSASTVINQVDVSDPTRTFTRQEFNQLGRDGREYVMNKRRELTAQRNQGAAQIAALEARISAVETGTHADAQSHISEITAPTRATGAGAGFGRGQHQGRDGRGGRGRGPGG